MNMKITNAVLADKIDNLAALVQRHIESDDKHFEQLHGFVDGNGNLGAKTRLDRLEQTERYRVFHVRALWTAFVSAMMAVVANWVWK
jgi:hypothetical protein